MAGAGELGAHEALRLVRGVRPPTPLQTADGLVRGALLKREDVGPLHCFKWRGALTGCEALRREGAAGVVTASTGNHGAAVAWAARRLGLAAAVFVPHGSSPAKVARIVAAQAELHEVGDSLLEAAAAAARHAAEHGFAWFEDGASPAQLEGAGTIGAELAGCDADVVLVPLACGVLAGGLARGLGQAESPARVVGVQARGYERLAAVLAGRPDPGPAPGAATIADGLADNRLVEPAVSVCRDYLDDVVVVDDDAMRAAIVELHTICGVVAEPAGAAALAALRVHGDALGGRRPVLVISGGNLSQELADELLR
jgi:threonine dehydratase